MSLTDDQRAAYLGRLGVDDGPPDLDRLRRLQAAHLRSVPFENLDIHLGRRIVLDPDLLVAKIVGGGGRGGFCYEVNGAFALLLEALGYRVTLLEGRSIMDGRLGIRFDHLCLRVDLDEPHLVDVGFGACFDEPLRLVTDVDQVDPDGTFRIAEADDGWLEVTNHGEPEYRFSTEPHVLADFAPGCEHHQTSPESHFTKNPVCTLRTADGRVTLRGRTLLVTRDGEKVQREVATDELAGLYAEHFDIDLSPEEVARLA